MRLYRRTGSPHWWFTVSIDGTRIRKSSKTSNKRAARRIAEAAFIAGRLGDRTAAIGDVLSRYYRDYSIPNKASSWRDAIAIKKMAGHLGAIRCNDEVARPSIAKYVAIRRQSVSAATVNRELAILKHALHCAENWGMIRWRDMPRINLLPEPKSVRGRSLTSDEIGRLMLHCSGRLAPFVRLLLATGMRKGEALRMRGDHIVDDVIRIPKTKAGGEQFVARPWWFKPDGPGPCFPQIKRDGWIRQDWKKATELAGLAGARIHDLRHTYGSALGSITDARTLQRLMRHSSLNMTERYWHPLPEEAIRASREWNRRLDVLQNGHKKAGAPSRKPRRS